LGAVHTLIPLTCNPRLIRFGPATLHLCAVAVWTCSHSMPWMLSCFLSSHSLSSSLGSTVVQSSRPNNEFSFSRNQSVTRLVKLVRLPSLLSWRLRLRVVRLAPSVDRHVVLLTSASSLSV